MNVLVAVNGHVAGLRRLIPAQRAPGPTSTSPETLLDVAELLDTISALQAANPGPEGAPTDVAGFARANRDRAATARSTAQQHVRFAWRMFRTLLAACAVAHLRRWARLGLAALLGGGLLSLVVLGTLAVLLLEPGPLVVIPAAAALGVVAVLTDRWRRTEPVAPVPGLAAAATDLQAALTCAYRAHRDAAALARAWTLWTRRTSANVTSWCRRHGVPADAATLRRIAGQAAAGSDES